MGKITVKHFLNTNLKAYVIGGEKYYSVYMLVTCMRKTTRLKSVMFSEMYTEQMYNDLVNDDVLRIEKQLIEIIVSGVVRGVNKFDVDLLTLVLSVIDMINANDLHIFSYLNRYNPYLNDKSNYKKYISRDYEKITDEKEKAKYLTQFKQDAENTAVEKKEFERIFKDEVTKHYFKNDISVLDFFVKIFESNTKVDFSGLFYDCLGAVYEHELTSQKITKTKKYKHLEDLYNVPFANKGRLNYKKDLRSIQERALDDL